MRILAILAKAFPADDAEDLRRYLRREYGRPRRSGPNGPREFSPELERLKYEILRSSV
jgi:hypothetical protein